MGYRLTELPVVGLAFTINEFHEGVILIALNQLIGSVGEGFAASISIRALRDNMTSDLTEAYQANPSSIITMLKTAAQVSFPALRPMLDCRAQSACTEYRSAIKRQSSKQ
ncbi:hypothetical protein RE428_35560 [Marinobacter nanhaiticus D15-8W]|nr:hypothetical protein RE428_35560 [Marinobacter nanhaiticus D15-8W]